MLYPSTAVGETIEAMEDVTMIAVATLETTMTISATTQGKIKAKVVRNILPSMTIGVSKTIRLS